MTADQRLAALLQRHAESFLRRSPEQATAFHYDISAHAALRSQLDDRSLAALSRDRAAIAIAQKELAAIDPRRLSPAARIDYGIASFVYDMFAEIFGYEYGQVDMDLRPTPYIVNQMNGVYYWTPSLFAREHPLDTRADGEAWLARLAAFAVALQQETERVRHDAARGVVPPDFVIDHTVTQILQLRDSDPATNTLVGVGVERARKSGAGDPAAAAAVIFRNQIQPALTRQAEALRTLRTQAVNIAGVWRLPRGEEYYRTALRSNTTDPTLPHELHRQGLEQCHALIAQLNTMLSAQGLTQGTVGARIAQLSHDKRFIVSNDDAGRARVMTAAEAAIAKIVRLLPRGFRTIPNVPLRIQRTPVETQDNSPIAFGGRGFFQLNLKNPGELALWRLPTLAHHEAIPGHHFQASVLQASATLPLARRIVRFSAYTEGWGLYAQQVADELGAYEADPFGRIGYIQSELWRAARIVVDTGIHSERWTREQATAWMVDNVGEDPTATAREIVRYCVYPGQACSFKVGANRIVAAREAARRRLGARFDVRSFHDLILKSGPMPMIELERSVAQWNGIEPVASPAAVSSTDAK